MGLIISQTWRTKRIAETRILAAWGGRYILLQGGARSAVAPMRHHRPRMPIALRFAFIQIHGPISNPGETVQPAASKRFHQNFRSSSPLQTEKKFNGKALG
jgi:hypothetical protein